jgi:HEAT repeat protein
LGKDQVLPMLSTLLDEQGTDLLGDTNKQEVIARALNLVSSPSCIPVLTKIVAGTSDQGTRRNSYEALARIGTPDAFSYLQQQAQSTTGTDQAASAVALARSDSPELRQWIAGAIQDGTLGKDAVKALSISTAAPDIFGNVLLKDGVAPAQKLDMLKELETYGVRGPEREKLATAIAPLLYSDGDLQKEAIKVVGELGGKDVSDLLFPFLYSDDPSVRKETFFSYIGFANPGNYQYLFDFLNDPDQKTRRMAISMIERFYGDSDRDALEQASQSQDPFISQQAQKFLTRFK